ncbi:MAG: prenyltransferase [Patescibacteria group bacterium]
MQLPLWLKVSRPRFWIYLLGPFLIGCAMIYRQTGTVPWQLWPWLLYFTYPANIFIYGFNDCFDYETDVLNAKKQGYEALVPPDRRNLIGIMIAVSHAPFLFLAPWLPNKPTAILLGFLFLGLFYSSPPLRFKVRPFWDSLSNVLYALPGLFAYALGGGTAWSPDVLIAAGLWCMAMHAYSAAPDIAADTQAGLQTIATKLGWKRTVLFCLFLYAAAALLVIPHSPLFGFVAGIAYVFMMAKSYKDGEAKLTQNYQHFPAINALFGMLLFFAAAFVH